MCICAVICGPHNTTRIQNGALNNSVKCAFSICRTARNTPICLHLKHVYISSLLPFIRTSALPCRRDFNFGKPNAASTFSAVLSGARVTGIVLSLMKSDTVLQRALLAAIAILYVYLYMYIHICNKCTARQHIRPKWASKSHFAQWGE